MRWIFMLLTVIPFVGCQSKKAVSHQGVQKVDFNWNVRYDRGACFGKCPVYTLYLRDDGQAYLNTRANYLSPGWYYANAEPKEVKKLIKELTASKFWETDLSSQPEIADIPSYSLTLRKKKEKHSIHTENRVADGLVRTFNRIDDMLNGFQWKPSMVEVMDMKDDGKNMLVQLESGRSIDTWLSKYEKFKPVLVRVVSTRSNIYLVTPTRGSSNDFLQLAKRDNEVMEAQMDKEVRSRGGK